MGVSLRKITRTETGVACGRCSTWENRKKITVHHATVADVRACHALQRTRPTPNDMVKHDAGYTHRNYAVSIDAAQSSAQPATPTAMETIKVRRDRTTGRFTS